MLEQGVEPLLCRPWRRRSRCSKLERQRQHAAEDLDLDLLIGPVVLGAQGMRWGRFIWRKAPSIWCWAR